MYVINLKYGIGEVKSVDGKMGIVFWEEKNRTETYLLPETTFATYEEAEKALDELETKAKHLGVEQAAEMMAKIAQEDAKIAEGKAAIARIAEGNEAANKALKSNLF
ncbi:hypothetical protein DCC81_11855 [Chitinophaga parva]|uniref:Uncharacterized protein n=1 Tax=Chitinophaga parva TaxID=2169414 RepID=A0A2T7BFD8_9BACT|nr:hypothetical protein [Chitinophaga parva]PUZ25001.1 hypothetical protein DCC81_11855 [Chitinophaga parva]